MSSVDPNSCSISFIGSSNNFLTVAVEDVRISIMEIQLANAVLNSIEEWTYQIEEELVRIMLNESDSDKPKELNDQLTHQTESDQITVGRLSISKNDQHISTSDKNQDKSDTSQDQSPELNVVDNIEVKLPLGNQYYP